MVVCGALELCSFPQIIYNTLFCPQQNKEILTGLKQLEDEYDRI